MSDWLKNNLWSLIIAGIGVITTFTLYGYRIDHLEMRVEKNDEQITLLNAQQNQIHVQLAQISTDIIQYIKLNIDRLFGQ